MLHNVSIANVSQKHNIECQSKASYGLSIKSIPVVCVVCHKSEMCIKWVSDTFTRFTIRAWDTKERKIAFFYVLKCGDLYAEAGDNCVRLKVRTFFKNLFIYSCINSMYVELSRQDLSYRRLTTLKTFTFISRLFYCLR